MSERYAGMISVVDDDASLRRSVRNLLMSVGFEVQAFASAEEFLESPQRANTGCLVLDLRLTGMSGLDLLKHLAAVGSRIPVIILTAPGHDQVPRRLPPACAPPLLRNASRPDTPRHPTRTHRILRT